QELNEVETQARQDIENAVREYTETQHDVISALNDPSARVTRQVLSKMLRMEHDFVARTQLPKFVLNELRFHREAGTKSDVALHLITGGNRALADPVGYTYERTNFEQYRNLDIEALGLPEIELLAEAWFSFYKKNDVSITQAGTDKMNAYIRKVTAAAIEGYLPHTAVESEPEKEPFMLFDDED
ncbi:hypothetical protein KAZ57_03575, partial [Patescibacteria group bacterium]|nr:hypothetical protein [Patescibacteria group bacterium]